jgi:hypothetical protein
LAEGSALHALLDDVELRTKPLELLVHAGAPIPEGGELDLELGYLGLGRADTALCLAEHDVAVRDDLVHG